MEITLRNVPANSTITISYDCVKSCTQTNQKQFKTVYAGSKVVAFTLDGIRHPAMSQNELKHMLLDSVKDQKHIPKWLRKGTSSDDTYRFVMNNKSVFEKFSIVLRMADGTMRTISN